MPEIRARFSFEATTNYLFHHMISYDKKTHCSILNYNKMVYGILIVLKNQGIQL